MYFMQNFVDLNMILFFYGIGSKFNCLNVSKGKFCVFENFIDLLVY